jgi:hypothetical protein
MRTSAIGRVVSPPYNKEYRARVTRWPGQKRAIAERGLRNLPDLTRAVSDEARVVALAACASASAGGGPYNSIGRKIPGRPEWRTGSQNGGIKLSVATVSGYGG